MCAAEQCVLRVYSDFCLRSRAFAYLGGYRPLMGRGAVYDTDFTRCTLIAYVVANALGRPLLHPDDRNTL